MASEKKHLYFMGICGTAMGSVAAAFRDAGYRVTGSDSSVYDPMKSFLESREEKSRDFGIKISCRKKQNNGEKSSGEKENSSQKSDPEKEITSFFRERFGKRQVESGRNGSVRTCSLTPGK